MALIQEEIKELRKMSKDLSNGKIDIQTVNAQIGIFSQVEKRIKLSIQALAMEAKFKGKVSRDLKALNLLGDKEAIDTGTSREVEMIKCPNTDKLISRAECLDFSGSHSDMCVDCEHKSITQNRLLGAV